MCIVVLWVVGACDQMSNIEGHSTAATCCDVVASSSKRPSLHNVQQLGSFQTMQSSREQYYNAHCEAKWGNLHVWVQSSRDLHSCAKMIWTQTYWQISPCAALASSGAVDGGYLRGDSSCELQVSAHTGPGSPRPPDPHMTAGTSTAVSPHTLLTILTWKG